MSVPEVLDDVETCLVGLVVGYRSAERFASDRP